MRVHDLICHTKHNKLTILPDPHARTDKQEIQQEDGETEQYPYKRRGLLTCVGLEAVESAVDAMAAAAVRRRRSSELALPVSTGLQMRHGLYVLLGERRR
jgi:hypothetical protein